MTILGNRNIKYKFGVLLTASAIFAFGVIGNRSIAGADQEGSGLHAPLEGTWILTIDRLSQGVTFSAFQSFTAGGVTVATGTIDRTPPPPISPLYGSWRRKGHERYVATICFFAFDSAGNAVAMIKTPEAFQMIDNDHLTGSGTGLACDINGDNCTDINSPIAITGKRLVAHGPSD